MHLNSPEVREIALAAFPNYNGRTFKVEPFTGPQRLDSYWSEGSRDYYALVNLATKRQVPIPENGTPFCNDGKVLQLHELPINCALVRHAIARGKDMGVIIYVRPENLTPLLPAPVELTWAERVVLTATKQLKSSYGGIKNFRLHEASRQTGISEVGWNRAKANLIARGLLNSAGAITDAGRNACDWPSDLYYLRGYPITLVYKTRNESGDEVEIRERGKQLRNDARTVYCKSKTNGVWIEAKGSLQPDRVEEATPETTPA